MTPLPKRRTGKAAKNRRRSHLALRRQPLTICSTCKNIKRTHRVCPTCGTYRGIEVIDLEEHESSSDE